jgi:hypothetical protein
MEICRKELSLRTLLPKTTNWIKHNLLPAANAVTNPQYAAGLGRPRAV